MVVRNNTLVGCTFHLEGEDVQDYVHTIDKDNTVYGRYIAYYYEEKDVIAPDDAGHVILVNCSGFLIEGLYFDSVSKGVELINSHDNRIRNNTFAIT